MSTPHDERCEELLRALLTGEGDPSALRAELAALEGSDVCEEKLRELEAVADLVSLSRETGGAVPETDLPEFAPGEQAAEQRLRELAAREFADRGGSGGASDTGRPAPLLRGPWLTVLLAAAAVLVIVVPLFVSEDEPVAPPGGGDLVVDDTPDLPPDDLLLGEGDLEVAVPPDLASWDALVVTWRGVEFSDPEESYVLRVESEEGQDLLGETVTTRVPTWRPTPDQTADWPDTVLIQVGQLDMLNEEVDTSAWRVITIRR